jgi:hypothetical protein
MTVTPANSATPERIPAAVERKERRGVAITALVLGLVSIAGSPLPILNNATIIAGIIGVPFGIIGLFGVKKTTAAVGLVLAIGGVVIGLMLQQKWSDDLDKLKTDLDKSVSDIVNADPMGGIDMPITPVK